MEENGQPGDDDEDSHDVWKVCDKTTTWKKSCSSWLWKFVVMFGFPDFSFVDMSWPDGTYSIQSYENVTSC
jgi:hypothetical protein